jgi:hypothetical protein
MRLYLSLAIAVCLVALPAFVAGDAGQGFKEVSAKGITLQWKADSLGLLHVRLTARTTGFVAVGFDPLQDMKGANLILGYVKDGVVAFRDDFGIRETAHQSDVILGGKDNITDKQGQEKDGRTELSFTIPLNSGDPYDRPLQVGKSYRVLLSHGADGVDSFTTKHAERTRVTIKL